MNILSFAKQFPTESRCREHFRIQRERSGIKCKRCNHTEHYWLPCKEQWHCKKCSFRTTLRSGTIMESSKLPIRTWYLAMAFMSFSKKGVSAKELQRQLDYNRYETIWKLMHKIRVSMGKRDDMYQLSDMIEMDEAYFKIETNKAQKRKTKPGRGSKDVTNVMVLAESTPVECIKSGKKSKHCRYYKMKVLKNHSSEEISNELSNCITEDTILFTDKSTSYNSLSDIVEVHISEISSKETTVTSLKWVHIAISNAKRNFLGVYHKIKGKYLQNYLSEFCYKLNRRYFNHKLFDRVVIALATIYW